MGQLSFIYTNIYVYRTIMQILLLGGYYKRFHDVISHFHDNDKHVLDLCFGDIYIAQYCRKTGRNWTGYDINKSFVHNAVRHGFHAERADILDVPFPRADVCVMIGGLCHFQTEVGAILAKMLAASPRVILSEPVKNLSARRDLIGFAAKRACDVGKGKEDFRYNRDTFMQMLESQSRKQNFIFSVKQVNRNILVELQHG